MTVSMELKSHRLIPYDFNKTATCGWSGCGQECESDVLLYHHIILDHVKAGEMYCGICDHSTQKAKRTKASLIEHIMQVHVDYYPYKCNVCSGYSKNSPEEDPEFDSNYDKCDSIEPDLLEDITLCISPLITGHELSKLCTDFEGDCFITSDEQGLQGTAAVYVEDLDPPLLDILQELFDFVTHEDLKLPGNH